MEFNTNLNINLSNGVPSLATTTRSKPLVIVDYSNATQPMQFIFRNDPPSSYKNEGCWSYEEDRRLKEVMKIYGDDLKWTDIAKLVGGRNDKQCRDRWQHILKPGINRETWSLAEELLLSKAQAELGNKWATIAKMLNNGRTGNMVKSHWNTKRRRAQFPMDYRKPKGSRTQTTKVLPEHAETMSTQASSSRTTEMASDVTQAHVEDKRLKKPIDIDINELPLDDDDDDDYE